MGKLDSSVIASASRQTFEREGFLISRGRISREDCLEAKEFVRESLSPLIGPAELEVDVGYPGAPKAMRDQGGDTPRRLLHAYARSSIMTRLAHHKDVKGMIHELMDEEEVMLSQCHHNCVMTKFPTYSSSTDWHQDIRYWHYDLPELISVWIALDREDESNGALRLIPGSHKMEFERGELDKDLFFRKDKPSNQSLIEKQVSVDLDPGDLLFFHCRLLHSAGPNLSSEVKLSPVFTFHKKSNLPIEGTRSSRFPSIVL